MENDNPVPTNAADATEEVNQQQAEDVAQGVQPHPEVSQPDERVPEQETNDVVTSDQPVTEPARAGVEVSPGEPEIQQPDEPDNPDSELHQQTRQDIANQGDQSANQE